MIIINNNKFEKLFIELETITKSKNEKYKTMPLADVLKILKDKRITPYYKEYEFLDFCRYLRNSMFHDKKTDEYIEVSDLLIEKLERLIKEIKNPDTAFYKSTKNIFSANIDDLVKEKMTVMKAHNYTHIPIYDNNKLVGIFSENSMFNYLYKNEIIEVDNNTKFKDILDYVDISNTEELILFVSKNTSYDDVVNKFISKFKENERLSCIMVTEHGKSDEKVLGIITAWDILGR